MLPLTFQRFSFSRKREDEKTLRPIRKGGGPLALNAAVALPLPQLFILFFVTRVERLLPPFLSISLFFRFEKF